MPRGQAQRLPLGRQRQGVRAGHHVERRPTYVVQYRIGGRDAKTRRYTIRRHGSPWTPHTARERALDILQLVRTGVDPIDSERDARRSSDEDEADRQHFDFDAFADRFIEKHVKANALRSLKDIEGTFDRDLRPWFKGKSVRRITKADVKAMRTHVADRSLAAANKALKWLNRMFTWGIEHDRLDDSPMYGLTKPFAEPKRDRVLDRSEIRTLVAALPAIARVFQALVIMLLLTGQRLREVAGRAPGAAAKRRGRGLRAPAAIPAQQSTSAGSRGRGRRRRGIAGSYRC